MCHSMTEAAEANGMLGPDADLYRVYVRVQALTRTCAWGPPRAQHNKNWWNQTRVGDLEVTYGCWAYLKEKKTFEKIVYSLSSKCFIFKKVLSHIFYFIIDQNPGHKIGQNAIFTSKVFISWCWSLPRCVESEDSFVITGGNIAAYIYVYMWHHNHFNQWT